MNLVNRIFSISSVCLRCHPRWEHNSEGLSASFSSGIGVVLVTVVVEGADKGSRMKTNLFWIVTPLVQYGRTEGELFLLEQGVH